ncbi:MAG: tRNA (adenosine(37)-N6)-dimethylallyltransferase MiaA [Bacilli bacterium]|nr:tRNA (adenosine(37)-N6)-dimethylallyltransferase MiaA [Bacilli bacterium]
MIITIVGPTGVGKTKLSLALAKKYNGEIINADSTQIFKELNIGTAKIIDTKGIPHHLIDIKNLAEKYTVYDYQKDARNILKDILKRNKTPIIVGGSGLYLTALLYDYKFTKEENIINEDISIEKMHSKLLELGLNIDLNNKQRIKRKYLKHIINKEPITNDKPKVLYETIIIGLTTDRDILYDKINSRVDEMIENGLLDEARNLFQKYPNCGQLHNTIDYKEFIPYFNNESTLEDVINIMKQNSRNFAKRQYTWFNNKLDVDWFQTNYNDFNQTIKEVINYIDNSK